MNNYNHRTISSDNSTKHVLFSNNLIHNVHQYNNKVETEGSNLPVIKEIRWCLVSGGVYKHKDVSKLDVAKATIRGMMLAKCKDMNVTMMYDDDTLGNARLL